MENRRQVEQMVYQIDDDGNIEFEEFQTLIKGSKKVKAIMQKASKDQDKNNDIDIIFNFFKQLQAAKDSEEKTQKTSFGVYYS